MRKILFSIFLVLIGFSAFSQGKRVMLIKSSTFKGSGTTGLATIIDPIFEHEGSTLAADSALLNNATNTFDAYGRVVITQPSGTTIYSDVLNYNGNTRMAVLTNNVRMVDGDATLTTNYLTYNMLTRVGTYTGNGKIVNANNTLTSRTGYYFATTRDAYFRHNVVLTTPDALIKTDTLRYNSNSKIAYFFGPTNIYGKDDTLYTENGTYNTTNDQARFGKNNLYTQGSKSLKGDSLFYDRKAGFGRASGNVTFIDTAEKVQLNGGIGLYKKADESILVTIRPYVVIISESDSGKVDSIWMTADTLFSKVVMEKDILPARKEELTDQPAEREGAADAQPVSPGIAQPLTESDSLSRDSLSTDSIRDSLLTDSTTKISADSVKNKISRSASKPPDSIGVKTPPKLPTAALAGDTTAAKAAGVKPVKAAALTTQQDSFPADTARKRIVMAYHNARIFKSDLQARADSMFFSYSDSIVRCYVSPMIWAQGSQLSGDTIFLQMKNKKMDNMLLQHNSFIVNTDDTDSTNFNQVKGKLITGYFRDSKLRTMFVDGNAESLYYVKDDTAYTGLNHQISSRLRILLEDNKIERITALKSIEATVTPMKDLKEDDRILKGFIWKPTERPKSKEEIIGTAGTAVKPAKKATGAQGTPSTPPAGKGAVSRSGKQPVKTGEKGEAGSRSPPPAPSKGG